MKVGHRITALQSCICMSHTSIAALCIAVQGQHVLAQGVRVSVERTTRGRVYATAALHEASGGTMHHVWNCQMLNKAVVRATPMLYAVRVMSD